MSAPSPTIRIPHLATALCAGVVSLAWPIVSLAGVLASVVLIASGRGRERWAAWLSLLLATVGFGRFMAADGARAIVMAGRRSGEERAVSRLREIQWAEEQAIERHQGALVLGDLLGPSGTLQSDRFRPADGSASRFLADGYLFEVHLLPGRAGGYAVYAWPAGETSGRRLFFGDEEDRVCEAEVGAAGMREPPGPYAAFAAVDVAAERCAEGTDGRRWKAWRRKPPRSRESIR